MLPSGAPSLPTRVSTQAIFLPSGEMAVCSKRCVAKSVFMTSSRGVAGAVRRRAFWGFSVGRWRESTRRWKTSGGRRRTISKSACVLTFRSELVRGKDKPRDSLLQAKSGPPRKAGPTRPVIGARLEEGWTNDSKVDCCGGGSRVEFAQLDLWRYACWIAVDFCLRLLGLLERRER